MKSRRNGQSARDNIDTWDNAGKKLKMIPGEDQENRGKLGAGGELAYDGGTDHDVLFGQEQDQHAQENQDIPRNNRHRQPGGDEAPEGKDHEGCDEEELVCEGIQVGAQPAFLIEQSGQQTVRAIAEASDYEDDQCRQKLVIEQVDDENRDQDDPQGRDEIGDGHGFGLLDGKNNGALRNLFSGQWKRPLGMVQDPVDKGGSVSAKDYSDRHGVTLDF
jgi:hypothetical protein